MTLSDDQYAGSGQMQREIQARLKKLEPTPYTQTHDASPDATSLGALPRPTQ